jgi:hypothetical protein
MIAVLEETACDTSVIRFLKQMRSELGDWVTSKVFVSFVEFPHSVNFELLNLRSRTDDQILSGDPSVLLACHGISPIGLSG